MLSYLAPAPILFSSRLKWCYSIASSVFEFLDFGCPLLFSPSLLIWVILFPSHLIPFLLPNPFLSSYYLHKLIVSIFNILVSIVFICSSAERLFGFGLLRSIFHPSFSLLHLPPSSSFSLLHLPPSPSFSLHHFLPPTLSLNQLSRKYCFGIVDMKVLFWNCRGLGRSETQLHLYDQISAHSPEIILLSETLSKDAIASRVARKSGYSNFFIQPAVGRREGFLVMWSASVSISILFTTDWMLEMQMAFRGQSCKIIFVHASYRMEIQRQQWCIVEKLCHMGNDPLLVIGDFNAMLYDADKRGGAPLNRQQTELFLNFVNNCNLCELQTKGPQFTWSNGQQGRRRISEKLDRGFVNSTFFDVYPHPLIYAQPLIASDHCSMIVELIHVNKVRRRPFRFEALWMEEDSCMNFIKETWGSAKNSLSLTSKLGYLAWQLRKWSKKNIGNIHERLIQVKEQLQVVQEDLSLYGDPKLMELEKQLRQDYSKLLTQQEVLWYQKSRVKWLHLGDLNTRFFHKTTLVRRQRNYIYSLKDTNNVEITNPKELEVHIIDYFATLFREQVRWPSCQLTGLISQQVSDVQNEILARAPTPEEIWEVVKCMSPYKAPGPDGYPAVFYQRYWEVVGPEVIHLVQNFFQTGSMPDRVNDTFIVLIPKVLNPRQLSQYRPISLCNVIYKIITKVLVNRIRPLLAHLIAPYQNAFVPGRHIRDNILIHHEICHLFHKHKRKKRRSSQARRRNNQSKGWYALKLDFSKAYDRVSWHFLRQVLLAYGFHSHFINLIMTCVSSVSFSIMVNGSPVGQIKPTRGFRQGDPLSPYLFILCQQVLSLAISRAEIDGRYRGIKVKSRSPDISHLMFADDVVLYGHVNPREAHCMVRLLHQYCIESGQEINLQKSSILFSQNTLASKKAALKGLFNVQAAHQIDRYLGLPVLFKKPSFKDCQDLIERVSSRLSAWKSCLLSQMGRVTLIKSVLSAIPNYYMQCFLLPRVLLNRLDQLSTSFFWQHSKNGRSIATVCWDKITLPWRNGGLNIRRAAEMNKALMLKGAWQLHSNTSSLWQQLMKSIYFPDTTFMAANSKSKDSCIWKQLQTLKNYIAQGSGWIIASGQDIHLYQDNWLSDGSRLDASPSTEDFSTNPQVSKIIFQDSRCWNTELICRIWPSHIVSAIIQTPISPSLQKDVPVWRLSSNGQFTVASAYRLLMGSRLANDDTFWLTIWHLKCLARIRLFLWKCLLGVLPTSHLLSIRLRSFQGNCVFCQDLYETVEHLWLHCPFSRAAWLATLGGTMQQFGSTASFSQWFRDIISAIRKNNDLNVSEFLSSIAAFGWILWKHRNRVLFDNINPSVFQVINQFSNIRREIHNLYQEDANQDIQHKEASVQWLKPTNCFIKINFDGALRHNTMEAGVGIVARDSQGRCLAAIASRCMAQSSLMAEAIATLEAVKLAQSLNVTHLILEGDSLIMVRFLQQSIGLSNLCNQYPWRITPILNTIFQILSSFQVVEVNHIFREGNGAADFLANFSIDRFSCFWLKNPPAGLCHILLEEVRNVIRIRYLS